MDTPFFAQANDERVQSAIHRLVNHEVDFSGSSPADEPSQEVTHFNAIARFELIGNRRNSTLLVSRYLVNGEAHPSLYLARFEGVSTTFLLPRSEIDWWRTSQSSLRERHFLKFDPSTVSKVELVSGGRAPTTLRLLRLENSQWRIYHGQASIELVDFLGDGPTVMNVLKDVNDLIALAFVNDDPSPEALASYGLQKPLLTLTLEGAETQRLLVGHSAEDPQQSYAKLEGNESVYLVASEVLSRLRLDPLYYRDRSLEILPSGGAWITAEIRNLQTGELTDLSSVGALQASAIQPLSDADAEGLLAALRVRLEDFKADGFLDARVVDGVLHYGGVEMKLPFELKIWGSSEPEPDATLLLTRRLSGSEQYAWIAEQDLVVKLPQPLVDVLHPLLFATEVPAEWSPPIPSEAEAQPTAVEEPDPTEPLEIE